jgi:hypothetical protein
MEASIGWQTHACLRHHHKAIAEAALKLAEHPDESHGESADSRHEEKREMGNIEGHDLLPGLANRNSQLTNQPT